MAYWDVGDGRPLVLLHAFPLSGEMWRPQIDAARLTHRVIVPDLRGFGETVGAVGGGSLGVMADDLVGLLDRLGIDRFIFGGLSMGGYLAFEILRRIDRSRVTGLILADTRAGADSEEARQGRLEMADRAERDGPGPIADAMVGRLLGSTSLQSRSELVEQVRAVIVANSGAGIAGAQRAMASRPDSTALLSDLEMPTLVLVGEEDALTPPTEAEAMAAALPAATLARIPNAGHLSNMENATAFNAEMLSWLARA